jgi:hypothetical protein
VRALAGQRGISRATLRRAKRALRAKAPQAVAYLTQCVQEELKRICREKRDQQDSRHALEQKLSQALREREAIKDAIRRGLIGAITREMLEEVEARIQTLGHQVPAPRPTDAPVDIVLPQMIRAKLRELDKVLLRDVGRCRTLLRDLLGDIVLRPTSEGFVAELRGNVEGLLRLEEAIPGVTGNSGSGGWI